MGIFSRKHPPDPLPVLTVYLHSPADKVYKPNDTVSGYVTLTTPIPINPLAVEVSFWGISRVWLRTSNTNSANNSTSYTHYRDNAPLFDICFNALAGQQVQFREQKTGEKGSEKTQQHPPLQQDTLLHPGQTYTYPFSFRVPEGTDFNRTGFYKSNTDDSWTILPHRLPPTMLYGQKKDYPDNAYIEYGITSRLICPGIYTDQKTQEPVSSTAEIIFAPLNRHTNGPMSVVHFDKTCTLASSSLAGMNVQNIGFRQSMKDRFSKETPKLDFSVGIEIPDHLSAGAEFNFRTTFLALKRTENVISIPAITFTVLKLELLDFTFARAPRDHQASSTMSGSRRGRTPATMPQGLYEGGQDTLFREAKTSLNCLPSGPQTVELEEDQVVGKNDVKTSKQVEKCEAWFTARVPGFMPPSFKSFAISRCYRLRLRMGIEIGGKKFESEIEGVVNSLGCAL